MLKDILGRRGRRCVYNRRRTAITMVGMAWGIATVVLLLALRRGLQQQPSRPSLRSGEPTRWPLSGQRPASRRAAIKAGVKVRLTLDDVERISSSVPGILHISPIVFKNATVQNDLHTYTWDVDGVTPPLSDDIGS